MSIREKLAPGSVEVAYSLTGLGNVALARGDLAGARRDYDQALAIEEKSRPGSLAVAGSLSNLGNVTLDEGDVPAPREYQRALAIQEKLSARLPHCRRQPEQPGDRCLQPG